MTEQLKCTKARGMVNLQDDLVTQLNAAVAREAYRDASIIQHDDGLAGSQPPEWILQHRTPQSLSWDAQSALH